MLFGLVFHMPVPPPLCEQKVLLSQEVDDAVLRKRQAWEAHDRAVAAKQDAGALLTAFYEALEAERALIAKLDQHRKEHGC